MRFATTLKAGIVVSVALCCALRVAGEMVADAGRGADSDRDGLSDALEQQLLTQFLPTFLIGAHDCSLRPAEFKRNRATPAIQAENGAIYGQAFPAKETNSNASTVELHYYHLWRMDCGRHGHPLDTEHVAVLVHSGPSGWRALYWYAAAHEDTVCDVSQIARASTLHAEERGATVWISPGKHASYLNGVLCRRGCGAERCEQMTELSPAKVINLGEPGFPMNGSSFIASNAWPLEEKMANSNFPADAIARVNGLPTDDIGWFNRGRHPVQGVIARSSATEQAIATGGGDTAAAISVAGNATGNALSVANGSTGAALSGASDNTGNALQKSYRHTKHALGTSARSVGRALHGIRSDPQRFDSSP